MSFDITSGLQENKQLRKKAQRKSVYDQQREEETIRNATDRGYLRRMTVEFLNNSVGIEDRDLPFVGYLNITAQQLSSLGALQMCVSLRICILPGNYITEFDALAGCVNLWALDLHGNQVNRCCVIVEKAEMFCVSTTDREWRWKKALINTHSFHIWLGLGFLNFLLKHSISFVNICFLKLVSFVMD